MHFDTNTLEFHWRNAVNLDDPRLVITTRAAFPCILLDLLASIVGR